VKWGNPVLGTGATVSYAIVDRNIRSSGARNCGGIGPVDAILSANGVSRGSFEGELRAALGAWSAVANIRFVKGNPKSANILIGAQLDPRGRAYTNVDYAGGKGDARSIRKALICLNPGQGWKIGFDGNLDVYDLRYTLLHELGHAIGLDHPTGSGQLMDFRYLEQSRRPQAGDIAGAVGLYGTRHARAKVKPPAVAAAGNAGAPDLGLGVEPRQ
jgi:hypothetical protein